MFARRYFGRTYWGDRYFAVGVDAPPARGMFWGPRYFSGSYWSERYFPGGTTAEPPPTFRVNAIIIIIADAVAAALEAATLSQSFSVTRAYVPVVDIADLGDMLLTVVPTGITSTPITRGGLFQYDYVIDVGVQKRQAPTPTLFDPSMLLTEQVCDLFRGQQLPGYTAARCVLADNAPVFSPAHADEKQVFTSVASLTFRLVR